MKWTEAQQQRFTELRDRELAAPLSDADQRERDALRTLIAQAEAVYLAPALAAQQQRQQAAAKQLTALQHRNEELVALAQQHEQLLSEARSWLTTFEARHLVLREHYKRLAYDPARPAQR